MRCNSFIKWVRAASPKPLRPCSLVLTLKYPIAACIVRPCGGWRHDTTSRLRISTTDRLLSGVLA